MEGRHADSRDSVGSSPSTRTSPTSRDSQPRVSITGVATGSNHNSSNYPPSHSHHDANANGNSNSRVGHVVEDSIAFETSDHGVVSVNLNDLSSALGVRRADMVSQRVLFQAQSAPSRRLGSSLLGAAFSPTTRHYNVIVEGDIEDPRSSRPRLSKASEASAASGRADVHAASTETPNDTAVAATSTADTAATAPTTTRSTPPPVLYPVSYQRRHSTLRGTQVESDEHGFSVGSLQSSGAAARPTFRASSHSSAHPLRHSTPPPGGADALRRALAGNSYRSPNVVAGSVPAFMNRRAGSLSGHFSPSPTSSLLQCAHEEAPPAVRRHHCHHHGSAHAFRGDEQESETESDNASENAQLLVQPSARQLTSPDARIRTPVPSAFASQSEPEGSTTPQQRRTTSTATASFTDDRTLSPSPFPAGCTSLMPTAATATRVVEEAASDREARDHENDTDENCTASAPPPSRRVHFSDDVIGSISLGRVEDEYMRLLVVYSRPWYAYVLLSAFGFLLSLSVLSNLYLERNQLRVSERAMSVPFVFFLIAGISSIGLLVHLVLMWRPDYEEEQSFFEDAEQRERLPRLWMLSLCFTGGIAVAVVCGHTIGLTVAVVMAVALVGHILTECVSYDEGGDCITCFDVLGSLIALAGVGLVAASSAVEELQVHQSSLQRRFLLLTGWCLGASLSGVSWVCFTRQLRDMSQRVSQQFLLTSSLIVDTVALGIGAYVANALIGSDLSPSHVTAFYRLMTSGASSTSSSSLSSALVGSAASFSALDGPSSRTPHHTTAALSDSGALLPCNSLFPDVCVLLGGGLCCLLSWNAYHNASFYVDHVASAACMVMGAALSFVPFLVVMAFLVPGATKEPTYPTVLGLSAAGAVVVVLGAAMVVYAGVRYRREVEIRVVVE